MPKEPGPHPAVRQGAYSEPPAPPPSSHPDPAHRGDTLGSWGWILHNQQRLHCFPVPFPPTPVCGPTCPLPAPLPLPCLACPFPGPHRPLTLSSLISFDHSVQATLNLASLDKISRGAHSLSLSPLSRNCQCRPPVWTQATRCQLPDSSFFGVFNYNYYFNNNLNLRTSRYYPYSLP